MCFTWHGAQRSEQVVHLGPLALLVPLLERLRVAEIIDRHLMGGEPVERLRI